MQSEDERPLNIPTKIIPSEPIGIGQIPVQAVGKERLLIVIIWDRETNSGRAGWWLLSLLAGLAVFPSLPGGVGGVMPALGFRLQECGGGAGGKCRLSWGLSFQWHFSSLPPCMGRGLGD